jgi:hypothetical protein
VCKQFLKHKLCYGKNQQNICNSHASREVTVSFCLNSAELLTGLRLHPPYPLQNVTNHFTRIAQDPRVNIFGNVNVGSDVTVDEIRKLYNAVSARNLFCGRQAAGSQSAEPASSWVCQWQCSRHLGWRAAAVMAISPTVSLLLYCTAGGTGVRGRERPQAEYTRGGECLPASE